MQKAYCTKYQSLPLTERGVTDFNQLKDEFLHIKQTRLSLDDGQLRLGMTYIGTYIQSPDKVKLGIAVSLSNSEYDDKKVQIGDALVKLAQAIENRMGFGSM
ncbi:IclR family transcriptional regulator [Moraxella catarrhalis]|nr:IclR family transcriptional regulator [Moraxella catarrhalis]MPX06421.1 IclR family transcriptional regulator [Moraxella catarrhalis]MPX43649.1 IclR family transcriptional regulator [Moraxella catarrhalis]RKM01716.1 IclR family transcriptional regulator [Moraxella catarrhalis]RKM08254.1 IclR family transcriptional regulator [Moraxella catarrhalis]